MAGVIISTVGRDLVGDTERVRFDIPGDVVRRRTPAQPLLADDESDTE